MTVLSRRDQQAIANKYFGRTVQVKAAVESERRKFGSIGEYTTLRIVLEDDTEAVLFVKRIVSTPKNAQLKDLVMMKEAQFYLFLERKGIVGFAPRCYFVGEACLVLEDLRDIGFEMRSTLGVSEIKIALVTLAKLHAATMKHLENFPENIMLKEAVFTKDSSYYGNEFMKHSASALSRLIEVQLHRKVETDLFLNYFETTVSNTYKLLNQTTRFKNVCCHGDPWQNNILFKYENNVPTDCRLVDFQLLRYAPPAHDVTTLIFHNLDELTIRNNLVDFYQTYYDSLATLVPNLKSFLSFTEFMETCKIYTLVAKTTRILKMVFKAAVQFRISNKTSTPVDEIVESNDFLLGVVANDKDFAENFRESFNEFEHYFLNPKLNKEDCYLILNSKHYDILEYTLKPCAKRLSYTSDYQILTLKIFQNNFIKHFTYIVKVAEQNLECFNNECNLVSENPLTNFSPKCYLAIKNNLLVYDNFFDQNYVNISSRKCFGLHEVETVLITMAKMHASSLSSKTVQTLCHRSLNYQNIILRYDDNIPIDALFINFEQATVAHPALDFLSFLYFTTQFNFRIYQKENMQKFYYKQMEVNINDLDTFLTYEQFVDACERCNREALDAAIEYHSRALIEEKYNELNDPTWKSNFEAIKTNMYDEHPIYRDRQDQMQQELSKLYKKL